MSNDSKKSTKTNSKVKDEEKVVAVKRRYFFPQKRKTVEAESLEDAQRVVTKGKTKKENE